MTGSEPRTRTRNHRFPVNNPTTSLAPIINHLPSRNRMFGKFAFYPSFYSSLDPMFVMLATLSNCRGTRVRGCLIKLGRTDERSCQFAFATLTLHSSLFTGVPLTTHYVLIPRTTHQHHQLPTLLPKTQRSLTRL